VFTFRCSLVVLVNLVCKVWHIDASVRLTRDVHIVVPVVVFVLHALEPAVEHREVVDGAAHVRVVAVLGCDIIVTGGVANTGWLLNIEHVSLIVPGPWVMSVCGRVVHENVGSGLLEEA